MSDPEDLRDSLSGEDDLFGDGASLSDPEQILSDLDEAGEDHRRYDDEGEGGGHGHGDQDAPTIRVQSVKMFRHQTPKPTDGTVCFPCSPLLVHLKDTNRFS